MYDSYRLTYHSTNGSVMGLDISGRDAALKLANYLRRDLDDWEMMAAMDLRHPDGRIEDVTHAQH